MSNEIPIGLAKNGSRGWAIDDVAIVPTRRTRSPQDVSLDWQIDAYTFSTPAHILKPNYKRGSCCCKHSQALG